MPQSFLGVRIRARRQDLGLTQAALARAAGISASYLNLIESNKRRIAGALLRRLADELNVSVEELDGAAERRLQQALTEIAGLPAMTGLGVDPGTAGTLIARFPAWARSVVTLARAEQTARETARAYAERLTHDPFLSETVHRMLTRIASVRSAAEILTEFTDMENEERGRFDRIVRDEAEALTEVAEALAAYFDRPDEVARALTPVDEVEALFAARENHFAEIETAVEGLALPDFHTRQRAGPDTVPVLEAAREVATWALGDTVDAIVQAAPEIETVAARTRAADKLTSYAAGAMLMPMTAFKPRAAELGYDVEALATDFGVGVDAVCHRLTALPPGDSAPAFGYIQANASGTIVEMLGLSSLSLPRYASACPLWALYRAQQIPGELLYQRAEFPNGERFIFVARARRTGGDNGPRGLGATGFGAPRHFLTDMLAVSETQAAGTVYAPNPRTPAEEVGPACRLCPRRECAHRVGDPLYG